jgi:hypothetical protein
MFAHETMVFLDDCVAADEWKTKRRQPVVLPTSALSASPPPLPRRKRRARWPWFLFAFVVSAAAATVFIGDGPLGRTPEVARAQACVKHAIHEVAAGARTAEAWLVGAL